VTQHGSFPGRPGGRRARRDNDVPDVTGDVPDWAGYDAVPQDEREFRRTGRHASGQTGPMEFGQGAQAPWEDQSLPAPQPELPQPELPQPELPQWEAAQSATPQWDTPQWETSQQETPQWDTSQQDGLQSHGRHSAVQQRPRQESDWTGAADPDPMEAFSERWRRRGSESREERRADRRKRRRLLVIGGAAAAVVIAVAVYFITDSGGGNPGGVNLGGLVNTFLPGEIQQVPNACDSVSSATISQYLPGPLKTAEPPLNTGANSQCTWTLDKPPLYRVLEVNIQAYSPSGLASGDGSATFAAIDAYAEDEQVKQDPGPHSGQPTATVTDLSGMPGGNETAAFEATQVFTVNGSVTDVDTVVVRYRNVIVTVVINGLDHAKVGDYGPVTTSQLSPATQTVAQDVTGNLVH
jgi:hypothetical protein